MKCIHYCSVARSCPALCNPTDCSIPASLFLTISQSLPKFMFTASAMPSSHLILRCPLLLLPSIFPSTGPFPTSCLFASDDQSTGASASVLPVNIQRWAPLKLTGLISLLSKELSGVSSSTTVWRHQFFGTLPSLRSSSRYVRDLWEDHSLNHKDLCWQSNVSASQLTV